MSNKDSIKLTRKKLRKGHGGSAGDQERGEKIRKSRMGKELKKEESR